MVQCTTGSEAGAQDGARENWRPPHAKIAPGQNCLAQTDFRAPNRNGGRHCCQPPLRRAKDMPVFATRSAEASPSLDPGSPAQASLPTAAARESLAFPDFASRRKLHLGPLMPHPKTRQLRCSAALLGTITSASRFASHTEVLEAASRKRKIISSGASSRLATDCSRRNAPLPAGRDRNLVTCRPKEACDRRPDHLMTMHLATSRAKQKKGAQACG